MSAPSVIAAFDFDGTLTYRDTLLPFMLFVFGPLKTFSLLFFKLPLLVGFLLGLISRQQVKEAVLATFFGRMPLAEMKKHGQAFAERALNKHLKACAMKRLRWHQSQNHRCILISASIDVYLQPWAKAHGFDDVICSEVATENGRVTGKLQDANCWGAEKTRRLQELIGEKSYTLYAYGNSRGDHELLQMADYPFYKTYR